MLEKPKILEHDSDSSPKPGDHVLVESGRILAEYLDRAARRAQRQEHQAQDRRLAGARRAGEELKALRVDAEIEISYDLGAHAVAQADILEAQHETPH